MLLVVVCRAVSGRMPCCWWSYAVLLVMLNRAVDGRMPCC